MRTKLRANNAPDYISDKETNSLKNYAGHRQKTGQFKTMLISLYIKHINN